MELLWEDLARSPESIESPAWHKDTLDERGQRVGDGKALCGLGDCQSGDPQQAVVRIEILDEAQGDLIEGFRFYEDREVGLGSYFLITFDPSFSRLTLIANILQKPLGGKLLSCPLLMSQFQQFRSDGRELDPRARNVVIIGDLAMMGSARYLAAHNVC